MGAGAGVMRGAHAAGDGAAERRDGGSVVMGDGCGAGYCTPFHNLPGYASHVLAGKYVCVTCFGGKICMRHMFWRENRGMYLRC